MEVITITAVEQSNPQNHYTIVATDFDKAETKINAKLRYAFDKRETGTPYTDLRLSDSFSYIRSTQLGNVHFRIERHTV